MSYLDAWQRFFRNRESGTQAYRVNVFGRNPDIGTQEDIIAAGATRTYQSVARTFTVVSGAATDATGQSGAITWRSWFINSAWAMVYEDVTLNGTNAVTFTGSYLRHLVGYSLTTGANKFNNGVITVKETTGATTQGTAQIGTNRTHDATWTIPADHEGYILSYHVMLERPQASQDAETRLSISDSNLVFQHVHQLQQSTEGGSSYARHVFDVPLFVDEKSTIKMDCGVSVANQGVAGGFDLIIVPKG